MNPEKLLATRYRGDVQLLESLKSDPAIGKSLASVNATKHRNAIRTRLLGSAVRVDARLLPKIADSFEHLRARSGIEEPMEAYVYEDSAINAFVTKGRSHLFVVLSSGAVNNLSDAELQCVIGHELGHAIFEHVDLAASHLLETGAVDPQGCMQILAWSRAAEISADRVGLVCCGSLDVATMTLFKSLSGLNMQDLEVDPAEFARQWEDLVDEVVEGGGDEHWQLTHPFPPLRVKAMMLFDASGYLQNGQTDEQRQQAIQQTDDELGRLLAMMDPLARASKDSSDPILAGFFLWGGLYLALANGEFDDSERERLRGMTSEPMFEQALAAGVPSMDQCLAEFCGCLERRHQKLKALEIHRIIEGLLHVAYADGGIDDAEVEALKTLAEKLRITSHACELLISKYEAER